MKNSLTDVKGITIGHYTDLEQVTGCTVILCPSGAVAGVDQRGGAPGSREFALLSPVNTVQSVHAILLSGGSAFGLDAAGGVMRFLKEKNIGVETDAGKVPITPAAIIFDLGIGDQNAWPTPENAYEACLAANENAVEQGCIGAGTGATAGKLLGMNNAIKAGLGMATLDVGKGVIVSALIVLNALGDIIDPDSNQIIAGTRNPEITKKVFKKQDVFANSLDLMKSPIGRTVFNIASSSNTVIGVVATNAKLTKVEATKVAQMAQNGLARSIRPANTTMDGDTIFSLSVGKKKLNVNIVGAYAAQAVQQAILNAVKHATSLGGIPSIKDLEESI